MKSNTESSQASKYDGEIDSCIIGLERSILIPLIVFDALVNLYLTSLFLIPLTSEIVLNLDVVPRLTKRQGYILFKHQDRGLEQSGLTTSCFPACRRVPDYEGLRSAPF